MTQRNILKILFNRSNNRPSAPAKIRDTSTYPDAVKLVGSNVSRYSLSELSDIQYKINCYPEAADVFGVKIADMHVSELDAYHDFYVRMEKKVKHYPKSTALIGWKVGVTSEMELAVIEAKIREFPAAAKILGEELVETSVEDLKALQKRAADYPLAVSVLGSCMVGYPDVDELKSIEQRIKDYPEIAEQYGPKIAEFTDDECMAIANKTARRCP